ncbi:MAG: serine/threonine-protein kinase [Verrucomicrobiota bacterium]
MYSTGNHSEGDSVAAGGSLPEISGKDRAVWEAGLLEVAMEPMSAVQPVAGAPEVAGFEIIGRLGSGSSGEVWLAEESEPGRTVALKVMHRQDVGAGASQEVLQREFRILAKLVHPNLVLLYHGIVTADGRQGLAMEWIDGWPLDEWLLLHPDLSLEQKLELFHGVVRGVAYLHDHGVIHRDLKPANVIVDAQGVAKIVDFGLARLHQEGVASGMDGGSVGVSGTLHFMAPEQAANTSGARAMPVDVYALGLIFHRILTGEWLHSAEGTPAETLARVLNPPPLELRGAGRQLPRDLQSILRQSLAPDPALRYHHARELAADLERFGSKQPVAARKHTIVYLATTFLRRQARRSAFAGALVLAGLMAGGALYQRHRMVTERNEANLRYAYTLTSFTLRQLRDELRAATPDQEIETTTAGQDLPGTVDDPVSSLPVNAEGELDLRYYQAVLADLRSATSEGHARYAAAFISIQPALDLYSKLAHESPDDPRRLLDAAQARLSFARLLGRLGRMEGAAQEARKTLRQVERLEVWPGFDPAPLPLLRCDALGLIARHAYQSGDSLGAVAVSREMLEAGLKIPSGRESLPRLALAASDLVTYAIAAGPSCLPDARVKIEQATAVCRTAHEREPKSFPLACSLARCLHASVRISLLEKDHPRVRGLLKEACRLLIDTPAATKRGSFPLVWEIACTATDWAEAVLDHPDSSFPNSALLISQELVGHLRRSGDGRGEVLIQTARIYLYQSRFASQHQSRQAGVRPIYRALALLRPRQIREPDRVGIALLTAAALHHARTLADFPDVGWTGDHEQHLQSLIRHLTDKADELTPDQQRTLASLKPSGEVETSPIGSANGGFTH